MPALKNNLLLVEDDAELRTLLTAILTQSGYKVRAAEDGFSALAETRRDMPDIVLSDLYMIGMSGFELLSVVRRRFPVIRVIAMSSAFTGGDIPDGVAADSFYQKATSITSLLQILESPSRVQDVRSTTQNSTSTPIWIATHPRTAQSSSHTAQSNDHMAQSNDHMAQSNCHMAESNDHMAESNDQVMLPCHECLRIFSHLPENTSALVREAACAYCLTPVHFAMVETVDPGPPSPATHPIARHPAESTACIN